MFLLLVSIALLALLGGALGLFLGSLLDRGTREEGWLLGDLPSTLGLLLGILGGGALGVLGG